MGCSLRQQIPSTHCHQLVCLRVFRNGGHNSLPPQRQRQPPPSFYLCIPVCLELTQTTRRTDVSLKPALDVQVFQHRHPHCPGPRPLLPFVHLACHRRRGNSHPHPSPVF